MKKLVRVVSTLLTTVLLVACQSNKTDKDVFKPSLDTNTKCEIKVVGDYSNFEALEAEFDKFNEFYPEVELSYEKVDDYGNTIGTVLNKTENAPNIFFSYAAWMGGDTKYASALSHMEDLSDKALGLNLDCIRPGLLNHDANNKVVMVPVFSRTYGTLVNTDLFAKEGLTYPTTWTELLNVCQAFVSKGYTSPMMGYSQNQSGCWMNTVAYPMLIATLAPNPEAIDKANKSASDKVADPASGEYMREALNKVKQLLDSGAINKDACDGIADNYKQVLYRFFEGQTPMMICTGDTVSGRKKRESESEAWAKNPFNYTFMPIPLTEQGGYFIDSPSIQFSVNKDCKNLDMTNEFMRFLFQKEELKNIASLKGLINVTNDSFDPVYASFAKVTKERTFSPEVLKISDPLFKQINIASFKVGKNSLTIEDAVNQYGTLK